MLKLVNNKIIDSGDDIEKRNMVSGCFLHFHLRELDNIYPLDESVFLYLEEFILQSRNEDRYCLVDNTISVEHIGAGTTNRNSWVLIFFLLLSENYYFIDVKKEKYIFYLPLFFLRFIQFLKTSMFKKNFFKKLIYIFIVVFRLRKLNWKKVTKNLGL